MEKLHTTSCKFHDLSQNMPSDGKSTGLSSCACCLCIGDSIQMCVGCAVCQQLTLPGLTPTTLPSAYACILQCNHGDDTLTSNADKEPACSLMNVTTSDMINRPSHQRFNISWKINFRCLIEVATNMNEARQPQLVSNMCRMPCD